MKSCHQNGASSGGVTPRNLCWDPPMGACIMFTKKIENTLELSWAPTRGALKRPPTGYTSCHRGSAICGTGPGRRPMASCLVLLRFARRTGTCGYCKTHYAKGGKARVALCTGTRHPRVYSTRRLYREHCTMRRQNARAIYAKGDHMGT